ncbi:MAG: cation:proton antiporter [Candidatus Omnitrophica bacterium]|nr:cation:proton antiporter [Candidatus Omnitrophota bacterium]MCF7887639.1 cation:proton antiporter [Candidatus Omnitrophota bacterium]MCF7894978.1 cation:proton antiporter [Candidatus Omnitrophota bacterium]
MSILFFVGIALTVGLLGAKVFKKLKFPVVVGYLIAGIILGPSVLKVFSLDLLDNLRGFSDLALAIVAFIIGSQMRLTILKKMGRGLITIILSESFLAFFIVGIGVYLISQQIYLALIFAAIAPASAPAGTAVVLQEHRAKGPLTNTLYAVVGLDDGLAIIIYAFASALAKTFLEGGAISILEIVKGPLIEIFGSIILGIMIGVIFGYFVRKLRSKEDILVVSLGSILIAAGIAKYFQLSLILTNLSIGMVFANVFLLANRRVYRALESITTPVYIIFFLIAGAHLQLKLLPAMGLLGIVYIITRIMGLMGGAFLGASLAKQPPVIKKYLGFGILSQAGVAIGLALMATSEFSSMGPAGQDLAITVVNTIAATTIIFEIIGPIATKFAIVKAGESRI